MPYKTVEVNGEFHVTESDTDLVMMKTKVKDEARKLTRALNLGAGFNGFTPTFFTYDYSQIKKVTTENQ